jgi:protein-S-isoprenylcysteine O-methyltransferase Ste14
MLIAMPADPSEGPEPPPLPAALLQVWPVIVVGEVAWLVAAVVAFAVPTLDSWRPVTLAGLGVGLLGTGVYLWQRAAVRRGVRGAQTGLESHSGQK